MEPAGSEQQVGSRGETHTNEDEETEGASDRHRTSDQGDESSNCQRGTERPSAKVVGKMLVFSPDDTAGGVLARKRKRTDDEGVGHAPLVTGSQGKDRSISFEAGFHLAFHTESLEIFKDQDRLTSAEAWRLFCSRQPEFPFYLAAYSHFCRQGWTVRCGMKYGAEYLLYSRPVEARGSVTGHSSHAAFAVILSFTPSASQDKQECDDAQTTHNAQPAPRTLTWTSLQACSRLACQVSKDLLVAFVEEKDRVGSTVQQADCVPDVLSHFAVREMVVRRWEPSLPAGQSVSILTPR